MHHPATFLADFRLPVHFAPATVILNASLFTSRVQLQRVALLEVPSQELLGRGSSRYFPTCCVRQVLQKGSGPLEKGCGFYSESVAISLYLCGVLSGMPFKTSNNRRRDFSVCSLQPS
jgi:hypothetical protein